MKNHLLPRRWLASALLFPLGLTGCEGNAPGNPDSGAGGVANGGQSAVNGASAGGSASAGVLGLGGEAGGASSTGNGGSAGGTEAGAAGASAAGGAAASSAAGSGVPEITPTCYGKATTGGGSAKPLIVKTMAEVQAAIDGYSGA